MLAPSQGRTNPLWAHPACSDGKREEVNRVLMSAVVHKQTWGRKETKIWPLVSPSPLFFETHCYLPIPPWPASPHTHIPAAFVSPTLD